MKKAIEIKIELLKRGIKQKEIAQKLGITKGAVSNFIAGKMSSKRLESELKKIFFEEPLGKTTAKRQRNDSETTAKGQQKDSKRTAKGQQKDS